MTDYINGVLSSLTVAVFVGIIGKIKPYFDALIKQTPNISGTWKSDIINNDSAISTIVIKQRGVNITADLTRIKDNNKREFHYKGKIYGGGQVLLTWHEKKGKNFNLGAMVLILSSDMNSLRGKTTFYHHDKGEVIDQDKTYKKCH